MCQAERTVSRDAGVRLAPMLKKFCRVGLRLVVA
jgi:hypothetical protein